MARAADSDREDPLAKNRTAKERFLDSIEMNYEKWHDGVGYDLAALDEMTESDKDEIANILQSNLSDPWRAFEALERMQTAKARAIIVSNLRHPSLSVRLAASRYARGKDKELQRILIEALSKSEFYEGLTQALDQIETFHPQAVKDALLKGLLVRGDSAAVNFAGMLLYVYGKAETSFDWGHRPLFLRFAGADLDDRKGAFKELCEIIGIDPHDYLG